MARILVLCGRQVGVGRLGRGPESPGKPNKRYTQPGHKQAAERLVQEKQP
jgi:hypothetical protein